MPAPKAKASSKGGNKKTAEMSLKLDMGIGDDATIPLTINAQDFNDPNELYRPPEQANPATSFNIDFGGNDGVPLESEYPYQEPEW